LTRDQFNELPQIDVQVALGQPGVGHRVSERQLSAQRARRRIVLTVPYFMTAALQYRGPMQRQCFPSGWRLSSAIWSR
jgi:hypothetical protein